MKINLTADRQKGLTGPAAIKNGSSHNESSTHSVDSLLKKNLATVCETAAIGIKLL